MFTRYRDEFRHPGTRPPDPGPEPTVPLNEQYQGVHMTWVAARDAERAWCRRMRHHAYARALDLLCEGAASTRTDTFFMAQAALICAALDVPLPRELFDGSEATSDELAAAQQRSPT